MRTKTKDDYHNWLGDSPTYKCDVIECSFGDNEQHAILPMDKNLCVNPHTGGSVSFVGGGTDVISIEAVGGSLTIYHNCRSTVLASAHF